MWFTETHIFFLIKNFTFENLNKKLNFLVSYIYNKEKRKKSVFKKGNTHLHALD